MSGKNKLVPRLLGVTKESIVRVDERTKDVGYLIYISTIRIISLFLVSRSLAINTC